MLFLILFAALFTFGICNPDWATNPPTLDAKQPIYLAHVFFPPTMRFLAYTPPKDPQDLSIISSLDWCRNAQEVTDNLSSGARTPTFEFEGIDGLKIHDFFTDQAYISRHNQRFADCFVTPESGNIGACSGKKSDGNKFVGQGSRVWSCWVIERPDRKGVLGPREDVVIDKGPTLDLERVIKTEAMVGSSSFAAFTAAVTSR